MHNTKDDLEGGAQPPYVVISVESQKGGVGKTTVALNTARLLLAGGYQVLFFDLDIAGTEAAATQISPLWKEFCSVVTFQLPKQNVPNAPASNLAKPHEENVESRNLVEMYDFYMTGCPAPRFEWSNAKTGALKCNKLALDFINIFSSSAVNMNHRRSAAEHSPEVLFDEAHAAWFLDMVREIVKTARDASPQDKLAIVIDNSPGYSGLGPRVEEWVTDMGFDFGKFLFVSSADQQDISACIHASKRILLNLKTKMSAAKALAELNGPDRQLPDDNCLTSLSDEAKRFLFHLLEVQRTMGNPDSPAGERVATPRQMDSVWYVTVPSSKLDPEMIEFSRGWAMVHNRVPGIFLTKENKAGLQQLIPSLSGQELETIVAICRKWIELRAIAYSDAWALQFIDPEVMKKASMTAETLYIPSSEEIHPPPVGFGSGDDFLSYLFAAQHQFAEAAPKTDPNSRQAIRFPWYEFSPIWLFTQQFRDGIGRRELVKLEGSTEGRYDKEVREIYANLLPKFLSQIQELREPSWIDEALLAAHALKIALKSEAPGLSVPSWLMRRAHRLNAIIIDRLTKNDPSYRVWPKAPLSIPPKVVRERLARYLDRSQARADSPKFVEWSDFTRFCDAYRHALNAHSSINIMRVTAQCVQPSSDNVFLFVFAESLFHHVLLQQDMTTDKALNTLRSFVAMAGSDPVTSMKMILSAESMSIFTQVLSPILGSNGWGIIRNAL